MLTMNHVATLVLSTLRNGGTIEDVRAKIPMLLLPDALEMYGPRQQFRFTQHPVTGRISAVVFKGSPSELKNIKNSFNSFLQDNIPECAIDEASHPEVFMLANPLWQNTAYVINLNQVCAWNIWVSELVDISNRFEDIFLYSNTHKVVNGEMFREDLENLNKAFFVAISQFIKFEFGIELNQDWFEKNVFQTILKEYDEELAKYTWQLIDIPTEKVVLPEFVNTADIFLAVDRMVNATELFF